MMFISIAKIKIKPDAACDFSFTECLDAAAYGYDGFRVDGAAAVSGSIVNKGGGIFDAAFRYQATIELPCSRCGQDFCQPVSGACTARFALAAGDDESGEAEIFPIEREAADIAAPVLQEIFFSLPMQPLCRPDCRGLCPICGIDLNHHSCSCAAEQIDPRWEKLKSLSIED